MNMTTDFAYKFGCGRYIQQAGALDLAGAEVKRLGDKAYLLAGPTAFALTEEKVTASLRKAGVPFVVETFRGQCCEEDAARIASAALREECDVIVGIGGGRILDLAKFAAELANLPVLNIPTSSATCAAFTPLSVVYTPEGKTIGTTFFSFEVGAVLADMDILARQPVRLFSAGILDAMAKWIEVRHYIQEQTGELSADVAAAGTMARQVYERLRECAADACWDVSAGKLTQLVWNTVYLSIAGAGMVSGMARGQYQSALAHAAYELSRRHFTRAADPWLHGEIVGAGLPMQAYYNGEPEMAEEITAVMRKISMPVSWTEIKMLPTAEAWTLLYDEMYQTRFIPDTDEGRKKLLQAMKTVGGWGGRA